MPTAVDSSVLLDVLLADPQHADASQSALREAMAKGGLVVGEVVIAEIAPVLAGASIREFLSDWQIKFVPSSVESALLAGEMFQIYLGRGDRRGRVVPDFLIASHAQLHADGLLARDRGYYRDYFQNLNLRDPSRQK
ncbi:MAG TPA: type II toxin-antitoxin system VapC family toxin [Verrucomicrobiae bacterium]|nr:type II toxin-antitoxin system VapC family toxin [Verrucomicrobiae bacterium]